MSKLWLNHFHLEAMVAARFSSTNDLDDGDAAAVSNIRGMYSSRKSSVKRHIQNIHGRNANFVSFVDHLAGRRLGIYWPVLAPTYKKKNNETNKLDYMNIIKEELEEMR
jgi:hypothetical protein